MTFLILANPYTDCSNSLRPDTPFEDLNRITGNRAPLSLAKGVFDTLDPSIPHLGTIIIEGGASDDRLRWSEVCWAASLMAGRLLEYKAHEIVPVSTYRYTNCYLHLLMQPLQGICVLHRRKECTCDSSTL
jgi:hypothetical protein